MRAVDWKHHYRQEAETARGRGAVADALAFRMEGDPAVVGVLRRGGIVSVPHTSITDSADPLARVATSILEGGFERVVALGVLHFGALPEPDRELASELSRGGARAPEAFARLGGGFAAEGDVDGLAFDPELVANEFSLDLLLSVLDAAAAQRAAPRVPVTRIYVGATRDPAGSFAAAKGVARAVLPLLVPGVACVTTGDLVHFGHGYSQAEEIASLPSDVPSLERAFEPRVRTMLDTAFVRGDVAGAYEMSVRELRSDQRNLLPVLAALAGPGARPDLLSFKLTDYSGILGEPPPCVVATALFTVARAAPAAQARGGPAPAPRAS